MTREFDKLLAKAAAYCSKSEHCLSEVKEKLFAWGARGEEAEKIALRLVEERFVDHHRYALFYTRDKFRFNGWGRVKIRLMLRKKGIEDLAIDDALGAIDEEEYLDKLRRLIAAKTDGSADLLTYEERGRLFRFAYGRGFEPELISRLLKCEGACFDQDMEDH